MPMIGDTGISNVTDVATQELMNAAGYGTPEEGMRATFILVVLSVAATFLTFGSTVALVFLFGIAFVIHLVRFVIQMV